MNAFLMESLMAVARDAEAAGHGQKSAVYQRAAEELQISVATLHRKLKEIAMKKPRKKRADAGRSNLTKAEARTISAYLMDTYRNQGKRLASIDKALEVLRSNGEIVAASVNENTGELILLSASAVGRALYQYHLHPEQLNRPTPKSSMKSLHPNHVWQIDPSLCVMYYIPVKAGEALQVMSEKEFYKNKPENIRRIEKERVWRYVITDHASGWIYVHYVLGAESGKNLVEAFICATQKRHSTDPVHGIPKMVMVDPGSANTGAVFKNLCKALDVKVQVNQPGQPWAKGQVEKANDIVERDFEQGIRFMAKPPMCVEDLNEYGWQWMRWFNATKVHSRTKVSRYAAWAKIKADQLIIAPSVAVMRQLANNKPQTRKVSVLLEISFEGKNYSVADVPHLSVGETVLVTRNPWRADDTVQVIYTDEEGREVYQVIEAIRLSDFGFNDTAATIGEEFKGQRDGLVDTNRKAVERLVMSSSTDEEAKQKRKAKYTPFGGRIDPMKPITDTALVDYLPKRGTESDVVVPVIECLKLGHVAAGKRLADLMGPAWQPKPHMAWLKQRYPDGVPEDDIRSISEQLQQLKAEPLRLVSQRG